MSLLNKLKEVLRKVYALPGVKTIFVNAALSILREAVSRTDNTVDDKLVRAIEAAVANKNYRAVLNGKAKK